jgi:hypothetical protein
MVVLAPAPDARVVFPVEDRVVKAPVEGVEAPMVVPLIDPPVIVTPDEARVLAMADPRIVVVSRAEPILIVSAVVLLVAILIIFPAVPVPMLTVLALLPVPRLTAPVVPESRVIALVPVESSEPAPANVIVVAVKPMVSIDATPVKAPPVVTFNPPLDVSAKVPVALPMVVFPVPVVAITILISILLIHPKTSLLVTLPLTPPTLSLAPVTLPSPMIWLSMAETSPHLQPP